MSKSTGTLAILATMASMFSDKMSKYHFEQGMDLALKERKILAGKNYDGTVKNYQSYLKNEEVEKELKEELKEEVKEVELPEEKEEEIKTSGKGKK